MSKIGIAVSLYDKFDELELLVDIFRENFEEEYYICVCSNHPEGSKEIEERDIDIDEFIQGGEINYSPDMSGLQSKVHLISRVYNSLSSSCKAAADSDCDYVMHLHADAWPLEEDSIKSLISRMQDKDKKVAAKGRGISARTAKFPIGHLNDHFIIFESKFALERGLFDKNPLDLIPDRGIHTQLVLLLLSDVGWSNVLYYSDNSEQVYWDGEDADGVRPMMYNPKFGFVHIAIEDFPKDLGKSLQAYYLEKHEVNKGEKIKEFLDKYFVGKNVIDRIDEEESYLDRKLFVYGFRKFNFGRNIREKQEFLNEDLSYRISKGIVKNIFNLAALGYRTAKRTRFEQIINKFSSSKDPIKSAWPEKKADQIYSEEVSLDAFPQKYSEGVWFKED